MTDGVNDVPAGAADGGILSFDAAVERLDALDQTDQGETTAQTEAAEAEPEVEDADTTPETDASDGETEQADSESDKAEEVYLSGDAKTRLRDGREVTLADLKKAYGEFEEYRAKEPNFQQKTQEIEAKTAQLQQQEQFFQQAINHALQVAYSRIPPEPDASLREADPIEYLVQKDARDRAIGEFNQLRNTQQLQQAHAKKAADEERAKAIQNEGARLFEKIPELKDESAFKAFKSEILDYAPKEYGFSEAELTNVADHRELLVLRDAIAYRKLQAEKAKVQAKAKDAPPVSVQQPGRRVSTNERNEQALEDKFQKLRKTGSFADALAILNST